MAEKIASFEQQMSAKLIKCHDRVTQLEEVARCAQAVLTALNVGDVAKDSPLHLKLREVMITYRAGKERNNSNG